MDNPSKTIYTGREKQNKNTPQYVLDTTISKQTQITLIIHGPSLMFVRTMWIRI